jgi:hypothetical protein
MPSKHWFGRWEETHPLASIVLKVLILAPCVVMAFLPWLIHYF